MAIIGGLRGNGKVILDVLSDEYFETSEQLAKKTGLPVRLVAMTLNELLYGYVEKRKIAVTYFTKRGRPIPNRINAWRKLPGARRMGARKMGLI